jgi:hypothetical protein
MARDVEVIWVKRESEYFFKGGWTTQIRLRLKENFFSAVIPGRAKHEPGIHMGLWIPGLRQVAHPGMTMAGVEGLGRKSQRLSHRPHGEEAPLRRLEP